MHAQHRVHISSQHFSECIPEPSIPMLWPMSNKTYHLTYITEDTDTVNDKDECFRKYASKAKLSGVDLEITSCYEDDVTHGENIVLLFIQTTLCL